MELESLFGLPAHPLVVHAAVVLLPLAALATIVVALVPRARRHYAPIAFALAVLATISVGLAQGSGEELEEKVDRTELLRDHTRSGESVLPWAVLTTVAAGAVMIVGPVRRRVNLPSERLINSILAVVVLVATVGATWSVIDVGHSGAKAAWDDVSETP